MKKIKYLYPRDNNKSNLFLTTNLGDRVCAWRLEWSKECGKIRMGGLFDMNLLMVFYNTHRRIRDKN